MDISGEMVAVVVVNYGAIEMIEQNFRSLDDGCTRRIIIVDNFSSSAERSHVNQTCERNGWLPVLLERNEGFAGGVNAGLAVARQLDADVYLVINPDATINDSTVDALACHVRSHPDTLVAPRIVRPDGSTWSTGAALDLRTGRIRSRTGIRDLSSWEIGWLSGACLAFSKQLRGLVGGLTEAYFLYWEDVDFSVRVQRAGGFLAVREDLTVTHAEGGTQGRRGTARLSDRYYFYNCRNRLIFAARHIPRSHAWRWVVTTPKQSWAILLRGGRRQLAASPRPLAAAVAGSLAGVSAMALRLLAPGRPDPTAMRSTPEEDPTGFQHLLGDATRVRLYDSVRTAHLERSLQLEPAQILYRMRRYDFDDELAHKVNLVRAGLISAAWRLYRSVSLQELEINEPLMLESLPRTALSLLALHARQARTGKRVRVVTYAIGNTDPFAHRSPRLQSRIRKTMQRALAVAVWKRVDRIAFGTPGARDLYDSLLPRRLGPTERTLIPALPTSAFDGTPEADTNQVVYLGAFVQRKGVDILLRSWQQVRTAAPEARLVILGKGPLERDVIAAAERDPTIRVCIDPPRSEITDTLSRSGVAVLASQPTPGWREQVGLPIVEALAQGCSIVASTETGLADWLAGHGHQVVAAPTSSSELANAIATALTVKRSKASVLADLPAEDGRLAADRWMFGPTSRCNV